MGVLFDEVSSGTLDHSALSNLSFASSGHTGFQASLGFTPENISNKEDTTLSASTTKYPTVNLLKLVNDNLVTALGGKENTLGFTPVPNTLIVNGKALNTNISLDKTDIGLSNVDNTSDANKPISSAVSTALSGKQDSLGFTAVPDTRQINGHSLSSDITISKSDVGLGNVDNTSDINKPISSAVSSALSGKQDSLGFTPENVSNKENVTIDTSTTKYPTVNLLKSGLDTKENTLTKGNITAGTSGKISITGGTGAIIGSGVTVETSIENRFTFVLHRDTDATIGVNKTNALIVNQAITFKKAYIYARIAPTGQDLIIDIKKNGSTIWTTPVNRLRLVSGNNYGSTIVFDTLGAVEGDILTIDIVHVGITNIGKDITVVLTY